MDDFATPPADTGDAPIVLGEAPPVDDAFAAPPADFAAPPGDFASPPADDAPIVLGAPPAEDTPIVLAPVDDPIVETVDPEPIVPSAPSAMTKFNDEWQATLLERKDGENSKKAEYIQAAEVSMKEFQDQRESKREAKVAKNRQDEQEKLEAIEADLENDNSWQRVCKMVELSHDAADNSADVKRMRDTMILLKNDPTRASVLA